MLPARHRLRRSDDFRRAVRHGGRSSRSGIVAHVLPGDGATVRVGLIVGKSVGGAVERNRVKRRLRSVMAEQLTSTSACGAIVVLRAMPGSRELDYGDLRAEVISAVESAHHRAVRR